MRNCTGKNCPIQIGKIDPATCSANNCTWRTKPITNADSIRTMTDEEIADFITRQRFSTVNPIADKLGIDVTLQFIEGRKNVLDWLKQEVKNDRT